MRPRVFPAEDEHTVRAVRRVRHASMRPRVFPAEDTVRSTTLLSGTRRFNEAAGIPRGRLFGSGEERDWRACFNEAAGIPRGRLECVSGIVTDREGLQ